MTDAAKERDEALARVDAAADPEWLDDALEAVRVVCETKADFHTDEIWDTGLRHTREDRALGAVVRRAARLGWCVKTDRVRPSRRSHLSGKPVWLSRVYRPMEIETT